MGSVGIRSASSQRRHDEAICEKIVSPHWIKQIGVCELFAPRERWGIRTHIDSGLGKCADKAILCVQDFDTRKYVARGTRRAVK